MTTTMRTLQLMMMVMTMMAMSSSVPMPERVSHVKHTADMEKRTVMVNITRYGNNLCHECTTSVVPCIVTKIHRCSFNDDGEVLVSKENMTKNIDFNNPDRFTDSEEMEDDEFQRHVDRRKREAHYHEDWHHDFDSDVNDGDDDDSADKDKKTKISPAMCRYNYTKKCWEKRCEMKCCDGTAMDAATNGCQETDDEAGEVDSCMNGGTVSKDKTHCECPEGFSGSRCQNRKCSVTCQNGGMCQTRTKGGSGSLSHTTHNDDHCVCPVDTKGKFCETKVCSMQCKNNGTCQSHSLSRYSYTWCSCKRGYRGRFCEKGGLKDGTCPKRSTMRDCTRMHWRSECHQDDECPGLKKCCSNACHHRVCVYPLNDNATCHFKNQTYTLGTTFKPDACHLCTCNASHVGAPQGVVECARIKCPDMPKYCTNVVTRKGQCCPVCEEAPNVAMCAGNYTKPYFTNCPNKMEVVEVDNEETNIATLNFDLKAKDCKGHDLEVVFSQVAVIAGIGEENYQLVTATSQRDQNDNFAECAFHIWVKDPYPPVFVTCPADMVVPRPGPVRWEVPQAWDNVGLARPPTSRRKPNIRLNTGQYAIEYITEDYQSNPAVCKFIITVEDGHSSHDHSHQDHHNDHYHGHDDNETHVLPHHQHQKHESHSSTPTAIGLGVATSLIVIVLLCLAAFFWRRQRMIKNLPGNAPQAPGASGEAAGARRWNLNAASGTAGVPQYSLPPEEVMSPPSYSRVDDMIAGLAASGGRDAGELPTKTSLA